MRMSLTDPRYLKSQGVEDAVRDADPEARGDPRRREGDRDLLRAARRRLRPAVHRRRPAAAARSGAFHGGGGWATQSYGFFDVFKIPVKKGRVFNDRDTKSSTPVVVVNEALVRETPSRARTRSASG